MKFILAISTLLLAANFASAEDKVSQVESEIFEYYCFRTSACKAIKKNLNRDSGRCRVAPKSIKDLRWYWEQNNPQRRLSSQGYIRYFGPITGNYFYDADRLSDGRIKITAKIHFKNLNQYTAQEIQSYEKKIKQAADVWNSFNPYSKLYVFDFKLALKETKSVVSARLIRSKTSGPYFQKWSLKWSENNIAHEFGHVMGLIDESDYINYLITRDSQCNISSLMCYNNFTSALGPKKYHFHLILQRLFCEV